MHLVNWIVYILPCIADLARTILILLLLSTRKWRWLNCWSWISVYWLLMELLNLDFDMLVAWLELLILDFSVLVAYGTAEPRYRYAGCLIGTVYPGFHVFTPKIADACWLLTWNCWAIISKCTPIIEYAGCRIGTVISWPWISPIFAAPIYRDSRSHRTGDGLEMVQMD